MTIREFHKKFPDDATCREFLRKKREEIGITCKRCKGTKHYWIQTKEFWKCASCSSWTNLKAGTVMHKSKLSVYEWFSAIHMMTTKKKAFSMLELKYQLERKRYQPVFDLCHKIRLVMGKRDSSYKLKGHIEMDDAFFEIVNLEATDEEKNKNQRGHGSYRQAKVLIMAESTPNALQNRKHKKKKALGFVKMRVLESLAWESISYELLKGVQRQKSMIMTDGYSSYFKMKENGYKHLSLIVPKKESHKVMPWVNTLIANVKRLLLDTHHSIGKGYLQNYLDEFCYKLNRRYLRESIFDRLLIAGIENTWW